MKKIVALDIAKRMGVIFYNHPDGVMFCTTYEGAPDEQLQMLLDVLGDEVSDCLFLIEELNTFVNAKTTRSLLHRVGYIKLTLEKLGAEVKMLNAMSVRKYIGAKNKADVRKVFYSLGLPEMSEDEADALAILCFGMDINPSLIMGEKVCIMTTEDTK